MKSLLTLLLMVTAAGAMGQGLTIRSLNGFGTNTYLKNPILTNGGNASGLTNLNTTNIPLSGVTFYGVTTNVGSVWFGGFANTNFATKMGRVYTNGVITLITNGATTVTIDGTTGNITNSGIIQLTNTAQANTRLNMYGAATGATGAVIDYTTNNVSRFSVDTAGNISFGSASSSFTSLGTFKSAGDSGGAAYASSGALFGNVTLGGRFSSSSAWSGTIDLGYGRNAAGVLEINNGTAGVYRDLLARNITATNGGFASYASSATNNIPGTGITNTSSINRTAIITATAVVFTIYNNVTNVVYTSPTFTGTISIPLQPRGAVTAASGLSGVLLDW